MTAPREDVEALRRLEARGGWDEADLNDFALIEARIEQAERELALMKAERDAYILRVEAAERALERWIELDLSRGPLDEGRRLQLLQLEDDSVALLASTEGEER